MCFACWKPYSTAKCPSAFFLPELPIHRVHQANTAPSLQGSGATHSQPWSFSVCRQWSAGRRCISACQRHRAGAPSEKWLSVPSPNPWVTACDFQPLLWFFEFFFLFSLLKKKKIFFFFEGLAVGAILKDLEKSHKQELLNNCSVKLKITVCSTTVELLCGRRKLSF